MTFEAISPNSAQSGKIPELLVDPERSVYAIIISYNPSPTLYTNVLALQGQVASTLVIDNGSSPEHRRVLDSIGQLPGTEILQNNTNSGIGTALNTGVRRALERRFPWVLTLDQDSRVGPGFVAGLLGLYVEHPLRERIGLIAPRYLEEDSGVFHTHRSSVDSDDVAGEVIQSTMMSGNLVRTDVIAAIGFYDESFFIDYVDHEFCLRMAEHGFYVLLSNRSILVHNLGRMSQRTFAGVTIATTNHSPLRRYYNARNRILTYRQHWQAAPRWVARDLKSFLVETSKIVLLEGQKGAKLLNVAKGLWDGLVGPAKPELRS